MTMEKMAEKKKLCEISQVLLPGTLKLISEAPTNEVNRALVLSAIKKPLPPECDTYEKMKDWIEHNIAARAVIPKEPFTATLNYSYRERGRCSYARTMRGNERFQMGADIMLELAKAADGCMAEFGALVIRRLQEEAMEDEFPDSLSPYEEETSDHDNEDSDQHRVVPCDTVATKRQAMEWARVSCPELFPTTF